MKIGTLLYLPPPSRGYYPEVLMKNLEDNPVLHGLLVYSDHPWPGSERIPNPEGMKNHPNKWAMNNLIFFLGLRIAIKEKFDHILYMECDSRVKNQIHSPLRWDAQMFGEYMSAKALMAGSLVCYNPFNDSRDTAAKFSDLMYRYNTKRNYPVVGRVPFVKTFGFKSSAEHGFTCLFPNGSLAIYSVEFLKGLFGNQEITELAVTCQPWDKEIGQRAWARDGVKVFDYCRQLTCSYSSYGDVLTSEQERLALLDQGGLCAVHQVKSQATPI